ncbi:DUF3619 family protein [Diaphorobacter aerolatus]|uniref:DUF3619 family protein n=1 Tax=Diaphorobacter aerolatus TaxID=1288495 RepID=A0A7H0GLA3_9BURK|nr:DUF3619 family protein [Diaphorobacter aerolatus]QNP49069.1 DUF3619 family protein [Diaphorobacter aerolatus]
MNRHISENSINTAAIDRFGLRLVARLNEGGQDLPYDIVERLRAGRMQALDKRKRPLVVVHRPVVAEPVVLGAGHTASLGGGWGSEGGNWWRALVSAVPVAALLVGLIVVGVNQNEAGANEVAEVDAALLTDDLPPEAYTDPGFLQYLKTSEHKP